MKQKAYLFVFDGLADWEPAHALCEINKSGQFTVVPVGVSTRPITTMGGMKLTPEATLGEVKPADTAVFMLPGGDMWQGKSREKLKSLLRGLHQANVLIAAICAATLEIGRAGLTHNIRHTSNSKKYLKTFVPNYQDDDFYVHELAVADQNIITASGLGSVEFAREIIKHLRIHSDADTDVWFDMFKHGVMPASVG